jgi:hypothetical protein
MKNVLAISAGRHQAPPLIWAILLGELSLGLAFFATRPLPVVALRGLRLFLRF